MSEKYINIDEPRYDQNTYIGRAKHFFITTNPLNVLASNKDLDDAKQVVEAYRRTRVLPPGVDEEKLWRSKVLMDSAYHPVSILFLLLPTLFSMLSFIN